MAALNENETDATASVITAGAPTLDLPEGDDDLLFADDDDEGEDPEIEGVWPTLIVDDDDEVHSVTKLALGDFVFDNKRLEFISARSGVEARKIIEERPDVAVILLDVVMERDDAGLRFVDVLRNEIGNKMVRVILRTGQPGQAPEQSVIVDYDINDYKTKPELTSQRLFTTMVVALRSFRDLQTIEVGKTELERLNATLEERVHDRTRELRETQARLVQSSKMASLAQLVAGVAHEINTPIASVTSSQKTLLKAVARIRESLKASGAGPEPDAIAKYLLAIERSGEVIDVGATRVAEIVKRLRSFARLDQSDVKRVDPRECISDAVDVTRSQLPEGVAIETQLAGPLPEITCYPGRLNQVILNLLSNSIDAVGSEGTITVSAEADGDGIRVAVHDDGPGIANEIRDQVFDPGFTTKSHGIGTGLGLSICYQIIRDHDGHIEIDTTVTTGARVVITLPPSPELG